MEEKKRFVVNVYFEPLKPYFERLEKIAASCEIDMEDCNGTFFHPNSVKEDLSYSLKRSYWLDKGIDNPKLVYTQYLIGDKIKFDKFIKKLSLDDSEFLVAFNIRMEEFGYYYG